MFDCHLKPRRMTFKNFNIILNGYIGYNLVNIESSTVQFQFSDMFKRLCLQKSNIEWQTSKSQNP